MRCSIDRWQTFLELDTVDSGPSVHHADLPTASLGVGDAIDFTFRWAAYESWIGRDYRVAVAHDAGATVEAKAGVS